MGASLWPNWLGSRNRSKTLVICLLSISCFQLLLVFFHSLFLVPFTYANIKMGLFMYLKSLTCFLYISDLTLPRSFFLVLLPPNESHLPFLFISFTQTKQKPHTGLKPRIFLIKEDEVEGKGSEGTDWKARSSLTQHIQDVYGKFMISLTLPHVYKGSSWVYMNLMNFIFPWSHTGKKNGL